MAEARSPGRTWAMRALFGFLCLLVMFFHLIPLSSVPGFWAPPDMIFLLAYIWAARRPDYVPALLVAGMLLLADFLFQRPPGLWAGLCLMAIESAKSVQNRREESTFGVAWLNFAVLTLVISICYRVVLSLTITDAGAFGLFAMQTAFTILLYPLVVALTHFIFRVRRSVPGEYESFG